MKRRAFITLLGGAAATWPIAARAQQVAMPVIGFLRSASIEQAQHMLDGLRRGLKEAGYVEGHNVGIDVRSAEGDRKRVPALLSELIGRRVALIVCNSVAAQVAKATINTVPIIFVFGGDPVKEGLVTSINRPEGNITGVTFLTSSISAKRFELLRELVPQSTTTGVLIDPSSAPSTLELKDIEAAAGALSREIVVGQATSVGDFKPVFTNFVERGVGCVLVGGGPLLSNQRAAIVALARRHGLPDAHQLREAVEIGGLMSYGSSQTDAYRQAGLYAGRILSGARPADLPIIYPSRFELVINLKTATALGLVVPQSLQVAADEVIE
jgi:putative ABC transport system substrate-binding protein